MKPYKQVALIIFDGWGLAKQGKFNAIENAKKPFFDYLWDTFPHTRFEASGEAVGLPAKNIGSSEIAHTLIGAGTILDTDIVKLNKLSKNGEISKSPAIQKAFKHVKKNNSTLHLAGLISPGGVHSHQDHLFALVKQAKESGIKKITIHAFTDGRDVPPTSGALFIKQLEEILKNLDVGFIATVEGRYFAMDRDNNWERLSLVEDALFKGIGREFPGKKPSEIITDLYKKGEEDEFLKPIIFIDAVGKKHVIEKNDSVILFNFRADRMRMLDSKLNAIAPLENLCVVTITSHDPNLKNILIAYPPEEIKTTLAEQISKAGLSQVHIAETEKYAHLTYFFNGGRNDPYPNEEDILIDSRKGISTHDQAPQMRAREITDKAIEQVKKGTNFIVVNFANADMVGHTGNYAATVRAIEELDRQLKRLVKALVDNGSTVFITADHGNAEEMVDAETGLKKTAHTLNPVPGILVSNEFNLKNHGTLADVAPTVLALLGLSTPKEMKGKSLLIKN